MGTPSATLRNVLSVLIAATAFAVALLALAGPAAAAPCSLPAVSDDFINPANEMVWEGELDGSAGPGTDLNQHYIQFPFEVAAGTTGMRIRYCYSKRTPAGDSATLDLGVYDALEPGADNWTMDDLRGWSGSSIRTAGIAVNGYTDEDTYKANRKAYVPGHTNRAFTPGPIEAGTWAVELGAGWIPAGGVDYRLGITLSSDPAWASDPFEPADYQPYVANPSAGWYQGDMHVHGEQEPGNATMTETLDLAFGEIDQGDPKAGAGLDFVAMVDHNNPNNRLLLGDSKYRYPEKLVIPGVEVTTYRGHMNSLNASRMVEFRTNPVHRFPEQAGAGPWTMNQGDLTDVSAGSTPAVAAAQTRQYGGWAQVNHPETYKTQPATCRGCAWTFDDAETGWPDVAAMEVANGIAELSYGQGPIAFNPFANLTVQRYEQQLATGDHLAATGSSDDHKAGREYGPSVDPNTDPITGQATTVVYARQLSPKGISDAVKAGQTYAKVFGADAPDVDFRASVPEGYHGIPGHTLKGSRLDIAARVTGAGVSTNRPGDWSLTILKDGIFYTSYEIDSPDQTVTLTATAAGRYGFELSRTDQGVKAREAYSTPIWFETGKPAPVKPKIMKVKYNRKKGVATMRVRTATPGKVVLTGPGIKRRQARTTANKRAVNLKIVPKAKLKKKLRRRGKAPVKVKVAFKGEWTVQANVKKRVVLKQKVKRKRKRR